MKRLVLVLAMAVFLLVGGCATYYHPYKTTDDFDRDKHDCKQHAFQIASDYGAAQNVTLIVDEMKKCMERKGWLRQYEGTNEDDFD